MGKSNQATTQYYIIDQSTALSAECVRWSTIRKCPSNETRGLFENFNWLILVLTKSLTCMVAKDPTVLCDQSKSSPINSLSGLLIGSCKT